MELNSVCFTLMSSIIASITKSVLWTDCLISKDVFILYRTDCQNKTCLASLYLNCFLATRVSLFVMLTLAAFRTSPFTSTKVTSYPDVATTCVSIELINYSLYITMHKTSSKYSCIGAKVHTYDTWAISEPIRPPPVTVTWLMFTFEEKLRVKFRVANAILDN